MLTERVDLGPGSIPMQNLGNEQRFLAINRVWQQISCAGYLCYIAAQQGTCCPSCAEGGMQIGTGHEDNYHVFSPTRRYSWLVLAFTPTTSGGWSLIKVMQSVLCMRGTNVSVSGGYFPRLLPSNPPPPEIHCSFPNGVTNNTRAHFIRLCFPSLTQLQFCHQNCSFLSEQETLRFKIPDDQR